MGDSIEPDPGYRGDELDRVTAALADKRRRYVLHYLAVNDNPASFDELADELAEWGSRDRRTTEAALVHRHLPRLADAGLIAVDREDETARITRKGEQANEVRSACVARAAATCW